MTIQVPRSEISRFSAAIAAAKIGPTADDLAQAPVLTHWCALTTISSWTSLIGMVVAHPLLGTNITPEGAIRTSPIVAIDPNRRWARSVSRWYRLDCAYTADVIELVHHTNIPFEELDAAVAACFASISADLDSLDLKNHPAR